MYKVVYGLTNGKFDEEVFVSSLDDAVELKSRIKNLVEYCYIREVVPMLAPRLLWTITEPAGSYEIEFSGITTTMDNPIVSTSLVDGHRFAIVANDNQDAALAIGIQLIKDTI